MIAEGLVASVAKVLVAVVVGLPLVVWLIQDRLIFYRQPVVDAQRAAIEQRFPAAKSVFHSTADGTRLHGWHVKGNGPLILYFGGNAEEVSWILERASEVPGVGWLLVDYRGYGSSAGTPSEKTLVADALAWFDLAATLPGVDRSRILAFGRSLGSGVAVQLAHARPLRALILASPYVRGAACGWRRRAAESPDRYPRFGGMSGCGRFADRDPGEHLATRLERAEQGRASTGAEFQERSGRDILGFLARQERFGGITRRNQ